MTDKKRAESALRKELIETKRLTPTETQPTAHDPRATLDVELALLAELGSYVLGRETPTEPPPPPPRKRTRSRKRGRRV